jgi:hypothetical protein
VNALLVLGALLGCDGRVDFVIDTTSLAVDPPGALLVVDLVQNGAQVRRDEIALDAARTVTHEDLLLAPSAYGVAAWVDADGDGRCRSAADVAWRFEFATSYGGDVRWDVDAAELRDANGCLWFEIPDTGLGGDGETR